MSKNFLKFLVVGGCHIDGYPVGKSNGFVEIAANIIGAAVDKIEVVSSINLNNVGRVGESCANFRPHILILQMGHFETTKHVRRGPGSRTTTTEWNSSRNAAAQYEIFTSRPNTLYWEFKNLVKHQFSRMRGTAVIDVSDIRRKLEVFCDEIVSFNIPHVILLSPLPCADRVSLGYRLKLSDSFREIAMKSGFVYLDVMKSLLMLANGKDIYYDSIHLNKKGHALLGQMVAKCLMDSTLGPDL